MLCRGGKRRSRAVQRTRTRARTAAEASCRSHASGFCDRPGGGGRLGGDISWGAGYGAATWVASTGAGVALSSWWWCVCVWVGEGRHSHIAWSGPVNMSPDINPCAVVAWLVGEGARHLLRPLIGLPLRTAGQGQGVVCVCVWMDMGWRCAVRKWVVRCARAMTRPGMPLLAVPWSRGCGLSSGGGGGGVWGVHSRSA